MGINRVWLLRIITNLGYKSVPVRYKLAMLLCCKIKFCQTSSNSWLISRDYPRYFSRLTAIYLVFKIVFKIVLKMKTRPSKIKSDFFIIFLLLFLYNHFVAKK